MTATAGRVMDREWLAEARRHRFQVCTTCLMDTSDPGIWFHGDGRCVHCERLSGVLAAEAFGPATRVFLERRLDRLADAAAAAGRGRPFDCVAGADGSLTSTYAIWLAWQLGLRVLAVHVDTGWTAAAAERAIRQLQGVDGLTLESVALDQRILNDHLLAFLRASTPDADCAVRHAVTAVLLRTARQKRIGSVIVGSSRPSARIMPRLWGQGDDDWRYIRSVRRRFGSGRGGELPHWGWFRMQCWLHQGIRYLPLADLAGDRLEVAAQSIERSWGWAPPAATDRPSVYEAFVRTDLHVTKFGFEKARADLSTDIVRGTLTRAEALRELERRRPSAEALAEQRARVAATLGINVDELRAMISLPPRTIHDYPNDRDDLDRDDATAAVRWIGEPRDPA